MIFLNDKIRRNVLVSTDHGLMIVNRFDCNHEDVGHGQWLLDHGSASSIEAHETYSCLSNISNPVIFDIGSNMGTYATWIARGFPEGKIYCFEPQRLVFQLLCGNIAINNFDNCHIFNMGIGSKDEFIEVSEPNYFSKEDFGIFSLIEDKIPNKSGVKTMVQIMKLDTFVETYKIPKIDFIKIDVEGMDIDVLRGAENVLKRYNPCIFIEHSDNRNSILDELINFLSLDNYTFKVIGNNLLAKPK